ncbi:hypothetical protein EJ06DRAFT_330421 [Trichodelitschia bisporula]|uniref:Uncharacterized protein n=1 Tax=Trichodelitschia bisporula TaxID=703511 RepID=A0A6G1I2M9_9PEZI|nr:hypothetical protein EJ06DRAFT_330421 [Trichodelitschia bisporula]
MHLILALSHHPCHDIHLNAHKKRQYIYPPQMPHLPIHRPLNKVLNLLLDPDNRLRNSSWSTRLLIPPKPHLTCQDLVIAVLSIVLTSCQS